MIVAPAETIPVTFTLLAILQDARRKTQDIEDIALVNACAGSEEIFMALLEKSGIVALCDKVLTSL